MKFTQFDEAMMSKGKKRAPTHRLGRRPKPEGEKQGARITVNMTDEQLIQLRRASNAAGFEGTSVSAFVRSWIDGGCKV